MNRERLGEITVPCGVLTILDPGHIAMFEEKEITEVPSLSVAGMPRDRLLPVFGVRVGEGCFSALWDHVLVVIADAPVAESTEIGDAIVDFSRLLLVDEETSEHWVHSECLDGLADFVFTGMGASEMAEALGATKLDTDTFGWRDVEASVAMRYGTEAEALKDQSGFDVVTDYRPHSHHWRALEALRGSKTESASIDVERARVCMFATTWADGLFPVYLDVDAGGAPVQLRIQLRTEASEDAMTHTDV